MTLKECYAALTLEEGATLSEVKHAYRKLAFALHPDLNPGVPDASLRFQQLNEAYVTLSQSPLVAGTPHAGGKTGSGAKSDPRAREEAHKAYRKAARKAEDKGNSGTKPSAPQADSGAAESESAQEDVLKDILNDPFARRVFEDIYSHIRHESRTSARGARVPHPHGKQTVRKGGTDEKFVDKFKGWLRKQIDDEQVLKMPGATLVPGARIRLQIQHGLTADPQTVELTLPPEFTAGKSVRLKGMGKRLGKWRGDLYVRIEES